MEEANLLEHEAADAIPIVAAGDGVGHRRVDCVEEEDAEAREALHLEVLDRRPRDRVSQPRLRELADDAEPVDGLRVGGIDAHTRRRGRRGPGDKPGAPAVPY